jgi:O-Antigen ligase
MWATSNGERARLQGDLGTMRARTRALGRQDVILPMATALALIVFAAENGGYYPTTWNWAALTLAGVGAIALTLREAVALSRLELITISALFALVGWVALSTFWTDSIPSTVREVQRDVVYPVGALAAAVLFKRRSARPLLGAIYLAITLIAWYALATRIFPDHVNTFDPVSQYRLSRPIGYWNALGILAVVGILLGLAFAARGRNLVTRVLAASSLVVLAPTLFFTYSRGAWIALAIGLVTAILLDTKRLQLIATALVVAPAPIVAVLIASQLEGLTRRGSTLAAATHDGHRLAIAIAGLAIAGGALRWAQERISETIVAGRTARNAFGVVLVLTLVGGLVFLFAHYGNPQTIAQRGWNSFVASPTASKNLNTRLLSLSSNGRTIEWHNAWHDYRAHPLLGSGAGTYEIWYLRHRTGDLKVRDAHSLYLEMLAEVGPVGLGLLLIALLTPLVAAVRARRHPLVATAAGAYVAFLVHAGVDWDWEMSAVTLTGILCGVALLIAGRRETNLLGLKVSRYALVGVAFSVAIFAIVGLLGNVPASRAGRAIENRDWSRASAEARKEIRWAPWSANGWRRLGQSEVGSNQLTAAGRDLRKAIRQDPQNWDRWFDLALATHGQVQRHALERALALNPRSPEVAEFVAGIGLKGIRVPRRGSG